MPNLMAALPNIGGALCSTPQSLASAHYYTVSQKRIPPTRVVGFQVIFGINIAE